MSELSMTAYKISKTGLPVYRAQFLNADTGEIISEAEVLSSADCIRYLNENPMIKDKLGFYKGDMVDTDLQKIIDGILYPYYPPEFVYIENTTALPEYDKYITEDTKTYKEKGTIVDRFSLAVKVLAGSKTLVKCTLVRFQNNLRENIENKIINIAPGKSEILDFNIPKFSNDIEYYFEISDNESIIQSVKLSYDFVLPIYVGYAKNGLVEPTSKIDEVNLYLNGLIGQTDRVEKRLVEPNTKQKAFFDSVVDRDNLCPFILVPLKWNSMVRIEDANYIDITKFYAHNNNIIIQTSPNNTDYEGYVLYISRKPVDSKAKTRYLREITYIFAHDLDWKDLTSEGEQSEVLTGFDILTPGPIDSRFVKESYDDLAYIRNAYEGLIVYIKNIKTYYKYNGYAWEVTNNMTRFYSGKPSDTMGGKLDISIDIATGDIYQKNNSNVWELKGNMRGV